MEVTDRDRPDAPKNESRSGSEQVRAQVDSLEFSGGNVLGSQGGQRTHSADARQPLRYSRLRYPEPLGCLRLVAKMSDQQFYCGFHAETSDKHAYIVGDKQTYLQAHKDTYRFSPMNLSQRMKAARKHAGITQRELAQAAKVEQPLISQLETGKTQKSAHIAQLARACGVSALWLASGEGDMLAADGSTEAPRHESNVEGGPVRVKEGVVPVVGMAKLGLDGFFDALDYPAGHGDGYVQISSNDPNAYALKVMGDSMDPRIRSGEFVLIEPNKPYMSGDEVLVQTEEGMLTQSMIKVFMHERDGLVRLLSVNNTHPPITIERSSILKIHPVGAIIKPSRYVQFD